MVYTFDSKSNAARLEGSSPSSGTKRSEETERKLRGSFREGLEDLASCFRSEANEKSRKVY